MVTSFSVMMAAALVLHGAATNTWIATTDRTSMNAVLPASVLQHSSIFAVAGLFQN